MDWLPISCILFAHNCFAFDARVLSNAMESCRIAMDSKAVGFDDTLPLLRAARPGEASYSLFCLYQSCFANPLADAHSALADVQGLRAILEHVVISKKDMVATTGIVFFAEECQCCT
eukprot:scpid79998/ scgid11800/ 